MVSAYQYVHGSFDYNKTPLAPLGCAVQLYESNSRRGTWAEHSTNGWYIGTSMEHYRCHRIYVKKTRSERISDTVFFKHKYITQPTVTPADTIVKALDDLTHALKGRRNVQGTSEIETLERIDELLNNIPQKLERNRRQERQKKQVTFDESTAPPKENRIPTARQLTPARTTSRPSIEKAIIDKPIQPIAPTPRVQDQMSTVPTPRVQNQMSTVPIATTTKMTPPTPRVLRKSKQAPPTSIHSKIREKIREKETNRSRIQHRTHMQLRQQEQRERVQLIRDEDTGEYLKYRQLIRSPKHSVIWNKSSANEFGRLAQGLPDGRVKGTNTIFFIHKNLVPKE
jgi:hypothetical protein